MELVMIIRALKQRYKSEFDRQYKFRHKYNEWASWIKVVSLLQCRWRVSLCPPKQSNWWMCVVHTFMQIKAPGLLLMLLQGLLSCAVNERWAALRTLGAGQHKLLLACHIWTSLTGLFMKGRLFTQALFACHRKLCLSTEHDYILTPTQFTIVTTVPYNLYCMYLHIF